MHITGKDFTEMYYFVQLPHPLLVHVSVVDLYVTMNTLQDTRHIALHVLKEVKNIMVDTYNDYRLLKFCCTLAASAFQF